MLVTRPWMTRFWFSRLARNWARAASVWLRSLPQKSSSQEMPMLTTYWSDGVALLPNRARVDWSMPRVAPRLEATLGDS